MSQSPFSMPIDTLPGEDVFGAEAQSKCRL